MSRSREHLRPEGVPDILTSNNTSWSLKGRTDIGNPVPDAFCISRPHFVIVNIVPTWAHPVNTNAPASLSANKDGPGHSALTAQPTLPFCHSTDDFDYYAHIMASSSQQHAATGPSTSDGHHNSHYLETLQSLVHNANMLLKHGYLVEPLTASDFEGLKRCSGCKKSTCRASSRNVRESAIV